MRTVKKICCYAPLLAGMAFGAVACSNDDKDTTGPVITLAEPEDGETFTAGSKSGVHIEFDLADESGLNTFKVDIHSGEGHSHESQAKAAASDWSFQKTYDEAKGLKSHKVHVHSDSIWANATIGDYHFGVSATDVHGNESAIWRTIKVDTMKTNDEHEHEHEDE
jgi:hypothetical protein